MAEKQFVVLNGKLLDATDARVPLLAGGLMFEHGVFETIRVREGKPTLLPAHLSRLRRSCTALGLGAPRKEGDVRRDCERLCEENGITEGNVKLMVYRDARGANELIISRDFVYPPETYTQGFRLKTMVDDRPATGPAHKSTNYAKNHQAREAAKAAGFDEALFYRPDGKILEGAVSNLFIVKGDQILTPPARFGILPGVVRELIVRRGASRGVREAEVTMDDLAAADEVFVTNALLGVMPVSTVDQRLYSVDQYEVTMELALAFRVWEKELG